MTAGKHGKRSAICFWPGSEAEISGGRPDVWLPYLPRANEMTMMDRARQVLEWFGNETSPDFAALYLSDVDTAGHLFGPDSREVQFLFLPRISLFLKISL